MNDSTTEWTQPASRSPVRYLTLNSPPMKLRFLSIAALLLAHLNLVFSHSHHDELTEEAANAPVYSILWIHIFLQAAVWGVLFPIGMVLGLARSRWHVPLQVRHSNAVHSPLTDCKTEHRFCADLCWVYPRSLSRRTRIPFICAWSFFQFFAFACPPSVGPRHLSQTPHT